MLFNHVIFRDRYFLVPGYRKSPLNYVFFESVMLDNVTKTKLCNHYYSPVA